ncbi:asparagine synthase-related protein [Microtetraspora malaysiensis]|uniref:asparagine synthase-related protein n=1 Tax=Microtetraspora malaysiensis TaxID=161358 RepID=UPI003D8BD202
MEVRVFLAVVSKVTAPTGLLDQVIRHAESLVDQFFPVPPDTVAAVERRFPGAVLLGWGNEGESGTRPPLITATDSRAIGVTGTLLEWSATRDLLDASSMGDTAHRTRGCFAALRVGPGEMTAVTDITRACGIFYAETPELHVVGTRALLVHLIARGGRPVRWDAPALQSMVRQGYFLSDETPFEGVRALPPATTLEIRDGVRTVTSVPLPESGPVPASRRAMRGAIEGLAEALLETVRPLTDQVNLALTGGRDSRLMAALLHAAKVPFRVTTNGLDDHPDVVIARQIAAKLGVEHTVIPPKRTEQRDAVLVEHPLRRTFEVLRTCEGMTSAYETIVEYLPYSSRLTMSGQSGEILRGGFLYSQGNPAPQAMRRRVDAFFLKDEHLFTEEANAHARDLAAPWQERAAADPARVLDHLYVTYRVGRWHAAARAGSLRRGDAVQPFLDNRVVAAALALDPMWRRSEEVVHELIGMFAPELRRIPIEGAEWRFRAERAPSRWESLLARRRTPAPATQKGAAVQKGATKKKGAAGWNWRTSPGERLTAVLREGVLDGDVLWDIVRKDAVEEMFAAPAVKQPALAWNLYTVGAMLSELYPGGAPDGLDPVEVLIPR